MSATLPTAGFLAECDAPMREALLRAHADRLRRAECIAETHEGPDCVRLRRAVRERRDRLYARAYRFGVDLGPIPPTIQCHEAFAVHASLVDAQA